MPAPVWAAEDALGNVFGTFVAASRGDNHQVRLVQEWPTFGSGRSMAAVVGMGGRGESRARRRTLSRTRGAGPGCRSLARLATAGSSEDGGVNTVKS